MFPQTEHFPAASGEQFVYEAISIHIRGNLRVPKILPALGSPVVVGTAVPKAAINENCDALAWKSKIRLSG